MRQQALEALAEWNGEMGEHSFEPLVYAAWVRALQKRLITDELGGDARPLSLARPAFLERVFRDVDGASVWCDIVQTTPKETCADQARQALDEALIDLSERYGRRMERWRWGEAHRALHRHEVLGGQPGLNWAVNIEQSTPGGDFTLLRGQSRPRDGIPFANVRVLAAERVHPHVL